uniref:Uncharacterized protein n=1 Tax=Cacopsylla melanoneura TaxID=428564 RepID=A0A8D8LE86_9HEMI
MELPSSSYQSVFRLKKVGHSVYVLTIKGEAINLTQKTPSGKNLQNLSLSFSTHFAVHFPPKKTRIVRALSIFSTLITTGVGREIGKSFPPQCFLLLSPSPPNISHIVLPPQPHLSSISP